MKDDPLDLNFPSKIWTSIYPSKEIEEHGKKLLSISDLKERLEYYNSHICSLSYSYSEEGLHCFGEYEHFHGSGSVFFRVRSGNDEEFETYLRVRQKEIDRLKELIAEHHEYYEKLRCFLEKKAGQVRFDELEVKSNPWERFIINGGGTTPENLLGNNNEINLLPSTALERKSFNLYLRSYIQRLIADPVELHWIVEQKYEGFISPLGMEAFTEQLSRVSNKEGVIKAELNRIETKFRLNSLTDYRDHLYPYKIENLGLWQCALFSAFVNGYQFDYSRKQLTPDEMKALIHVEQVFDYYNEVNKLTMRIEQKVNVKPTKNKLDFTKDKLRRIILELAALNGYEKPSTYLDELLDEVKRFNDFDFESNFFLNVHHLCKENNDKFWSQSHKQDISNWLKRSRIATDVFDTTWENSTPSPEISKTPLFDETVLQSVEDLKAFFDQVNPKDVLAEESLERGFKRLHDYINKNVHEDVRADLTTLQMQERNLSNWKIQLEYNEHFNSESWKVKTLKIISHITEALKLIQARIKGKKSSVKGTNRSKLTAPIIACFCNLANASGLMPKGHTESNESYCKRVCASYNLQYTDRVRQGFSGANSNKSVTNVVMLILTTIQEEDRERVNNYLNNKNRSK